MTSDLHDLDPDEMPGKPTPERAFRDAPEFEFRGKKLNALSFVRQTAAVALGLRYGSLAEDELRHVENPQYAWRVGAEATLAKLEKKKSAEAKQTAEDLRRRIEELKDEPPTVAVYDALIMDTAIVLWLCSQPDSICRKARRQPEKFEGEIDRWADENGIAMNSPTLKEATAVFAEIMAGLHQSSAEPNVEAKPGESPN